MPADWPLEALKAQAVIARTYLRRNLGRHKKEGFDFWCIGISKALSREDFSKVFHGPDVSGILAGASSGGLSGRPR